MTAVLPFLRAKRRRLLPLRATGASAFSTGLPWLLGSALLIVLPLYDQVPTWTLLVFGACVFWRYWLERVGKPLPSTDIDGDDFESDAVKNTSAV